MKVVVTGASGLLGRAVVEKLRADGHEVVGTAFSRAHAASGLRKVDLTDEAALQSFLDEVHPDAIVHSAAERRPDVVEKQPEASQVLNVEVPRRIAAWSKQKDGGSGKDAPLVIYISTDYVFDGVSPPFTVDDAPNPLNAYGRSKWDGEKAVREAGVEGRVTSLRVPVLYGKTETNDESAVNVLLGAVTAPKDGSTPKPKKMDANAVRYPTNVGDVAKALAQLCTKYAPTTAESIPPILHFSATEAMTKYDMCLVMARCLRAQGEQAETEHLEPEYEIDPSAATSRPRHCKLDLSLIKSLGIDVTCGNFESWWSEYLKEYAEKAREARRIEAEEAAAREAKRKAEEEEAKRIEEQRRQEEERKQKEEADRIRKEREEQQRREQEEKERQQLEEAQQKERQQKLEDERKAVEAKAAREAEKDAETQVARGGIDAKESSTDDSALASGAIARGQGVSSTDEPSTATPHMHASSSSTRAASLDSPSSPHPSFSSLQARPTPPATSGRSSPSPSMMSGGGNGLPISNAAAGSSVSGLDASGLATSMSTATGDVEGRGDNDSGHVDPLEYAAAQAKKQEEDVRQQEAAQANKETAGFFPEALTRKGDGASLGIEADGADAAKPGRNLTLSTDADSDIYGHPSPRDEGIVPPQSRPFAAGYGEVPYGLQEQSVAGVADGKGSAGGIPASATIDPSAIPQTSTQNAKPKRPTFQIRVGDPQKIGDPISAHIVYTVRIKTDSPRFKASQFSVLRRYSDFRWLHAALVHCNPGIFVPPVPEKVKIGRFAPDLVEARRHGLESCINKIANNPALQDDDDLRLFLESENFHSDVKIREQVKGPVPTPEQKTYFGWSTSLTGQTHRFHENDSWFDEQNVYLDHLELQLKNLVRIVSALAQQRKDVAMATSDYSHALMMLSGSSLSRSLSTCFAGLGEVERRNFELADLQSDADVRDFGSVVYEFERMVGSARKAFSTRINAWQTWQRLEDELRKARTRADKLKREAQQGSHRASDGRLQAALDEVSGLNARCLQAKTDFDLIGRLCKEEMDKFEADRIEGFHLAIESWLQGMIERQTEMMSEWEQYAALLQRQTGQYVSDLPPPPPPAQSSSETEPASTEAPAGEPKPATPEVPAEIRTETAADGKATNTPTDIKAPIATSDVTVEPPTSIDKTETPDDGSIAKDQPAAESKTSASQEQASQDTNSTHDEQATAPVA